jgi:hypothetical protein
MREKFIEVYDNVLPEELSDAIENLVLNDTSMKWAYRKNISGAKGDNVPGFACLLYSPSYIDKEYSFFFHQILYTLSNYLNFIVQKIFYSRLFLLTTSLNPTPLLKGIHNDMDVPHWVCLYYVNDTNGDTLFFDENNNEIKRVSPKKGRIAFFDGSIKHCSSTPSIDDRFVVNIDFKGYDFNK